MSLAGVGVDIVEIARMDAILRRTPRFRARVFTPEERSYCDARSRPAAHYAARFAAREAVLKA
ncbi:MAG: 4'-phosphopantetheinyl transferase superfamily protein, partial [Atopobiaceae bacterium]